MANRERGEVSLQIGERTYTLALTIDAMVSLEEMFSTPEKAMTFTEIMALADKGSMKHLRGLIWAVLQAHHPEIEVSQVSALVAESGGIPGMYAKLQQLSGAAAPDARDLNELGVKPPNPPRAQVGRKAGTGGRLTSRPVGLA